MDYLDSRLNIILEKNYHLKGLHFSSWLIKSDNHAMKFPFTLKLIDLITFVKDFLIIMTIIIVTLDYYYWIGIPSCIVPSSSSIFQEDSFCLLFTLS